jgi:hypothetical protein
MPPVKPQIFWHPTAKFTIGNYVKQAMKGGNIDRREEELVFVDHVYTAKTKKEIDFIKATRSFKNGQLQLCESIRQATSLTNAHNRRKQATQESVAEPPAPLDERVEEEISATG